MLIRIVLGKKFVQDTKLVVKYEVYSFSLFQMTILQLYAQQFLLNINFLFLSFSNMCIHSHPQFQNLSFLSSLLPDPKIPQMSLCEGNLRGQDINSA